VVRAMAGDALAEDVIGLARFREICAAGERGETDKLALDAASKPTGGTSADFATIAQAGGDDRLATKAYRLPLFVTRNFKSSTLASRNFKSGDVFASLYPITRSTMGGAPRIGRLTTVFGNRF
jgi:hypothetical protein